jgi:soluble lytic murein transglycosylase
MRLSNFFLATLLIVVIPVVVGPDTTVGDDPLREVEEALDQGRHWYATRLLRDLNGSGSASPEATLLAARADAGRGAWSAVLRRLEAGTWLDSLGFGEGRALLARARLESGLSERAVEDYRTFLTYSVERTPRALAELGLARSLATLDRSEEAAAAYARAAESVPELESWSSIRAAEILAQAGDTAAVRALLARAEGAGFYRRTLADVEAHLGAGNRPGARQILLEAAASRAAGSRSADLRARAAELYLADGDSAAAASTLRAALRDAAPRSGRAAASLLSQFPGLSAADHLMLARALERSGARGQAAREYSQYLNLQQLPTGERQALQLKVGELLYRSGSYFSAIDELEKLVAEKPGTATLARAEYYIARTTYRRGWRHEGRARLRQVAERYPGTGSAINALSLLGNLYETSGNTALARSIYEELVRDYTGSGAERTARFRLGILEFLEGDYSSARQHFDRLYRSERRADLKVRAAYWAARARLAEGATGAEAEAQRLFREAHGRSPFSYYGLLASERAGIDPWANLPAGPQPSPVDPTTIDKLAVIDLLTQAGLHEEAGAVLASIVESAPQRAEDLLGLSEALAAHGHGQKAVTLGWRAHSKLRGRWSASVLRAVYPLAYNDIILAESGAQQLDPYLVAAIVRQESAFASDVTSRAGARGLLQLMPATGRWWASRLGIRDYSDDVLFHPEINVHLGTAYFADLQRRYRELQISLVAYNAGPTRARRWRQRPEYRIDSELFAERIPFSETRNYVQGVQTWFRIYRNLYAEDFEGAQPVE